MDARPFVKAANDMGDRFLRLLDTLSAVSAVTAMDVRQKETRDVLAQALDILVRHQDLERSSIFMVEGDRLVFAAGTDFTHLAAPGTGHAATDVTHSVAMGEGLVGRAAATGEPQYAPRCSLEEMVSSPEETPAEATGSVLCMPITSNGSVVGVTAIRHPVEDYFKEWHRHVLALFCGVIGHMLASHEVVRRMEEAVEQRTRQLEAALEEAQELRRRYQELSTVDELTGLHNRRFFFPEAEAAVARAIRHNQHLCLVVLDLDRFKDINDTFGHGAGDRVLWDVAETLREYTREGDILARTGGEEFILALPHTSVPGARSLAERIRTRLETLRWPDVSPQMRITASIGIACLNETITGDAPERLERLIQNSDQAMYRCKRDGRNRVAVF